MGRDSGPHTTGAQPSARRQPASTRPTHGPHSSRQASSPSSGRHNPPAPHTGPLPQPHATLRPQRELRPQFRLRPGHDDALIRWLGSLSPRQRSRAIRTALCQYLDEQRDPRAADWREDPDLAYALDSLF
jgi:hypothetical protein